jgi:hypothetical protein
MMRETRTVSILQRVPAILAVTAASYGLPPQSRGDRMRAAAQMHKGGGAEHKAASGQAAAPRRG